MIDTLHFTYHKEGSFNRSLTVYALSTCGHCKRAFRFLEEEQIPYRYIYVDQLPSEVKDNLKELLHSKYREAVRFPFLVIDDEKVVTGFIKREWQTALGREDLCNV